MKTWKRLCAHLALSGVLCGLPGVSVLATAQQMPAATPSSVGTTAEMPSDNKAKQTAMNELPDSPGATLAQMQDQSQPASTDSPQTNAQQPATQQQPQTSSSAPSAQPQAQAPPQRPVGTAAAEAPVVSGVAASQPAGIAIAPAKQRRVRTIVLRMGALIGAGVAVGTVVALSAGTSSKPPGAH